MGNFILLIFGWSVFFFLHSFLANTTVKKRIEKHLWIFFRYYRLAYNIISLVGLILLFILNASIPSQQLIEPTLATRYFSLLLATAGVLIIKAAFKQYSLRAFMGVRYYASETFQSKGILNHMRHPLYAGTILLVAGFWLFNPKVTTLISAGCIFLYLPIGIWLEEKKLMDQFGDMYKEYKRRVPALLPKIRF